MSPWKTHTSTTILTSGKWLTVEDRTVETPTGQIIEHWPWVTTPDYVNVLGVTVEGRYLVFRQGKYGLDGESLAPVGGYIEPGEDPFQAARRELQALGERLMEGLPALLDHAPAPSLLHGDLWGGNMGYTVEGEPVIYDPAVYFGDREADLAMTELFGGFSSSFYAAYNETWPLDTGYRVRRELYNLYHVLNHYNLFGGGYAGRAEGMIGRLVREVGEGSY